MCRMLLTYRHHHLEVNFNLLLVENYFQMEKETLLQLCQEANPNLNKYFLFNDAWNFNFYKVNLNNRCNLDQLGTIYIPVKNCN